MDKKIIQNSKINLCEFCDDLMSEQNELSLIILEEIDIQDYKKMPHFKNFVKTIIKKSELSSHARILLEKIFQDREILKLCFPMDLLVLCKMFCDKEKIVDTLLEFLGQFGKENLMMDHYYEDLLIDLVQEPIFYEKVIAYVLEEHNLNLQYNPVTPYGNQPLDYWLVSTATEENLKKVLQKENLPQTFCGETEIICLSALYFKIGDIQKGINSFKQLDLFDECDLLELAIAGKIDIDWIRSYRYQDFLTQIIDAIVVTDHMDDLLKKELIYKILSQKKVKFVNTGIFELLNRLYTSEELSNLYEMLRDKNTHFITYRKEDVTGCTLSVDLSEESDIKQMKSLWKKNGKVKQIGKCQ